MRIGVILIGVSTRGSWNLRGRRALKAFGASTELVTWTSFIFPFPPFEVVADTSCRQMDDGQLAHQLGIDGNRRNLHRSTHERILELARPQGLEGLRRLHGGRDLDFVHLS